MVKATSYHLILKVYLDFVFSPIQKLPATIQFLECMVISKFTKMKATSYYSVFKCMVQKKILAMAKATSYHLILKVYLDFESVLRFFSSSPIQKLPATIQFLECMVKI